MASKGGESMIVAAIDFGTTYSGWAFSFQHEFQRDPLKISAKQWIGGQLVSLKGPTCVLIKPDGETVHSFGFDAENKYIDLAEDGDHEDWYFFKQFKMKLFTESGLHRDLMLEDASSNKLPALQVFKLTIKFLMNDLIKMSEDRIINGGITPGDIHWVLTVPAIWNDAAKQFMREAAQKAGIPGSNLTIALEPECASLYCRYLPVGKGGDVASLGQFQRGAKYLVLDAGGGTVDVTVHEVMVGGNLKELLKASGGDWGGTQVDQAYWQFLCNLLGNMKGRDKYTEMLYNENVVGFSGDSDFQWDEKIMNEFKENNMEDYLDLFRDFEIKKRKITADQSTKTTLRIPNSLSLLYKQKTHRDIADVISKSSLSHKMKLVSGDKLRLDCSVVQSFFDTTITKMIKHVTSLLQEPAASGCGAIVMVGGFSESPFLQEKVKCKFSNIRVIIPQDAGLAVLKGAVIFGHSPSTIAQRVCKYTYGTNTTHEKTKSCIFDHPAGETFTDDYGTLRCSNVFDIHVEMGTAVQQGEAIAEQIYLPLREDQTSVSFTIYASDSGKPYFVTDDGCSKIGCVTVPIPDTRLGTQREVGVSMMFGGTEIEVKCVDKTTGKVTKKSVDFLG